MINVDITGQLFPNVTTVIVQLCSTLILFLAAKKFLYQPVKAMVEKRSAASQQDLISAKQAKENALKDKEKAKAYLQSSIDRANQIVDNATVDANKQKQIILEQAKAQAASTIASANASIKANKQAMLDDLQDEMVDIALAASEKLIKDKVSVDDDRALVDAFIKDIRHE